MLLCDMSSKAFSPWACIWKGLPWVKFGEKYGYLYLTKSKWGFYVTICKWDKERSKTDMTYKGGGWREGKTESRNVQQYGNTRDVTRLCTNIGGERKKELPYSLFNLFSIFQQKGLIYIAGYTPICYPLLCICLSFCFDYVRIFPFSSPCKRRPWTDEWMKWMNK